MTTVAPSPDPYLDYVVLAPDATYKGVSAKQEFLNGRAQIEALSPSADVDEVRDRVRCLEWFVNANYRVEPAEYMRPTSARKSAHKEGE